MERSKESEREQDYRRAAVAADRYSTYAVRALSVQYALGLLSHTYTRARRIFIPDVEPPKLHSHLTPFYDFCRVTRTRAEKGGILLISGRRGERRRLVVAI